MTTISADMPEAIARTVRNADSEHVLVGPLSWQPSDGSSSKVWYFVVATSQHGRSFTSDMLMVEDEQHGTETRLLFIRALTLCDRPLVVHSFDDEYVMVRWCEFLWPCEKVTQIRAHMEAERHPKPQ
jgi:hypothetical protein